MTNYKVSYDNVKTGKRDYLRDRKGNIRYYSKTKATDMSRILGLELQCRIVQVEEFYKE